MPGPLLKQEPGQAAGGGERRLSDAERQEIKRVLKLAPHGPEAARARYFLAADLAAAGDWKGAGEAWQKVLKEDSGSGWDRLAQFKAAQALEQLNDPARAFVQYQALLTGTALADLPERSRAACQRLGQSLDAESLRLLIALPADAEFQPALRLRLMELDLEAGRLDLLRAAMADYSRLYPSGPFLDKLDALSRRLEAAVPVDRHKLGLLLPLNGPFADFGLQIKRGIDLALEEANRGRPEAEQYKLVVLDESGGTATAMENLGRLVQEEQVIGVLGPLSSEVAAAALPLLGVYRVPLLSPSAARPDLANGSPWFFRNCLTPEKQAASMADYALLHLRLTRTASLAPDKAYGQALAKAYAARFTELGGTVAAQVSYAAGSNDFREAMLALGGLDPAEGKNAEQDEQREQQARVEESSTALGRMLLEQAGKLSPAAGVTYTAALRVLVLDLAEDAASKALNAGRAFAARYARTLGQLPQLEVLGPQQAEKALRERGWDTDHLSPQQAAELGKALGAAYVLGGGSAEVPADGKAWAEALARGGEEAASASKEMRRYAKARWFNVAAQVVDSATGEVAASRRFQFSKYKQPPSNPLGIQALYLPASGSDVAQVVPNLRFYDLKPLLLGSDLWDQPVLRQHLDELEGAAFSSGFWAESTRPEVQQFLNAYKQSYAAKPGLLAAQAYDAARLMLGGLAGGAGDRLALREALLSSELEGASGRSSFGGRQDAQKRLPIIEVRQGQLKESEAK